VSESFPLSIIIGAIDRLSGPLTKMESKLGSFGKKATKMGKTLTSKVTAPALALGTAILGGAGLLEEQMITLQGLTGKTAEGLSGVRQQAIDLGKSTIFFTNQVAAGQVTLTKAGLDLNEVLTATPQILDFAAASQQDFADAAKGALDVLKGQSLEVADQIRNQPALVRVTDMLMMAAKSATVEVEELVEGFGAGGSTAKRFGMEMEETAATLALLAEQGSRGAEGGTALRNAIVRLVNPATDAREVFKELKLVQSDFFSDDGEESFLGMANALDKLEGARPSQLFTIFGLKAGPNFLKVAAAGSDKMRQLTEDYKQNGITAKVADLRTKGIIGRLKALGSALSGAGQAAADAGLIEWFTIMVIKATELVNMITMMNPVWLKWAVIAVGLAAALGPVLVVVGSVAVGIGGLITGVTAAIPVLTAMATFLTATLIPSVLAFAAALWANPITWIVAGVLALIAALVLLYKKNETVRKVFDAVWDGIGKLVGMVRDEVEGFFVSMAKGMQAISNFFTGDDEPGGSATNPAGLSTSQIVAVAGGGRNDTMTKESKVELSFRDVPLGTQVTTDQLDEEVELSLGFAMGGTV
jgi:TP901 family phage tail tape measure protein